MGVFSGPGGAPPVQQSPMGQAPTGQAPTVQTPGQFPAGGGKGGASAPQPQMGGFMPSGSGQGNIPLPSGAGKGGANAPQPQASRAAASPRGQVGGSGPQVIGGLAPWLRQAQNQPAAQPAAQPAVAAQPAATIQQQAASSTPWYGDVKKADEITNQLQVEANTAKLDAQREQAAYLRQIEEQQTALDQMMAQQEAERNRRMERASNRD